MSTPKPLMNQQQRRYLKDRIDDIKSGASRKRWKINETIVNRPEPADIRRAREKIQRYTEERQRLANAEIARLKLDPDDVRKAAMKARERLLFATPEQALEEIEKLAKLYPFENE
jgi:hypothetical protein